MAIKLQMALKQVEMLEKQNFALQMQVKSLTEEVKELKKENAKLVGGAGSAKRKKHFLDDAKDE